jgi:hypothetical protein
MSGTPTDNLHDPAGGGGARVERNDDACEQQA